MRFLADESCDHAVVRALRKAGHDVLAVAELTAADSDDSIVMALARDQRRVLLTEDRDFGQLVYAHRETTAGVLFLRVHPQERASLGERIAAVVSSIGNHLPGAFVVMKGNRVRWGRRPRS